MRPGTVLAAADLGKARWPDGLVPGSAVRELSHAIGHTVAAAMTRGEPLTTARLLDTGISAALEPGQVALTIGLADGGQAAILQAGALVDVYAAGSEAGYVSGSPLPSAAPGAGWGRASGCWPSCRLRTTRPAAPAPAWCSPPTGPPRPACRRPAGQFLASLVPPS